MEAIFCYGLAFCDVEWSFEEAPDETKELFKYNRDVWKVRFLKEFEEKMEELNISITAWTFEDTAQLLLAHKDLLFETYDVEMIDKIEVTEEETKSLEQALDFFVNMIKEETGCVVDFEVKPQFVLAVNY